MDSSSRRNTPEDRLRAVLETRVGSFIAIGAVLRRNPPAGTPALLLPARSRLAQFETEFADPKKAGVTASTPARETRIEAILTPPAVAHARAAAAAAGLPPPAFIPAGYYADLIVALHGAMLDSWRWANPMDKRKSLDTSAGGHIEGIATEAKTRVDALFGDYGSKPAPSLTFAAGNLEDRGTIAGRCLRHGPLVRERGQRDRASHHRRQGGPSRVRGRRQPHR